MLKALRAPLCICKNLQYIQKQKRNHRDKILKEYNIPRDK